MWDVDEIALTTESGGDMDTLGVVEVLAALAGLALVLAVAGDAVSTLVTTRRRRGGRWPTPLYYRWTWRAWRAVGWRAGPALREGFLGVYGPLSLLGLLVMWVVLLVAGWGAIWWGLRSAVTGVDGYLDAVYFAGVGFFTVGFGDLLPTGTLARLLVIVEAFMGLVTMALVIGYLPTLYGAYSRRELQLLALDDLSDEPTTAITFLEAGFANGGTQGVAAAFAEWERWCDEVFDTHTAYPMLAMFRSRQPGQHWLTALGVVMDAAAITLATVDAPKAGPAARLWRRSTRMLQSFRALPAISLRAAELTGTAADEAPFRALYQRLAGLGATLRPY
ncbi:MAG TPA: potassium channel family protein, partial [Actinomycetota bacterium]|nr:potassium channel family protein [Actinomycetota bacterium]